MKVLNYNECAQQSGIVRRTFERPIASGEGPPIVEISLRRRGVIEADFEAWLLKRRRSAPGCTAESAPGLSINALPDDESSDSPHGDESHGSSGKTRRQSSKNSTRADFSTK